MRCIDADALKNRLTALVRGGTNLNYCIADMIDRAPTIEPERKKGEWNFIGDQMFECSECGTYYTQSQFHQMRVRISDTEFPKFCPNCGADMRGDRDG